MLTFLKIISSEKEGAGCTTYHTSAGEHGNAALCGIQCNGKRRNCGHQAMKQQEAPGLHKADVGRSWERGPLCLTSA